MKFNLKNRPKTVFKESTFSVWFEGFEKELRQKLDALMGDPMIHEERIEILNSGKRLMIKEILGE